MVQRIRPIKGAKIIMVEKLSVQKCFIKEIS
jgi:hypothetical protein